MTCYELKSANNGHWRKRLEDLVHCDLIHKNIVREKEIKRKDAIYQLCDFFSLFYLAFLDRAEVERQYWVHHINTPEINSWMGLTYERICLVIYSRLNHYGLEVHRFIHA